MNKPLAIRRVGIAVSVFFGVLTVALCVLWVRSNWWLDIVVFNPRSAVTSNNGYLAYNWIKIPNYAIPEKGMAHRSTKATGRVPSVWYKNDTTEMLVSTHFGLLTVVFASIAAGVGAEFCSARFSLRTMLIATTLVAVVLGLGVWLAR